MSGAPSRPRWTPIPTKRSRLWSATSSKASERKAAGLLFPGFRSAANPQSPAARVPAKRRPFPVKPTVERLASLAYERGLPPAALRTLVVDVLAAPGILLDQASLGSLVRSLYPSGAVADDVVLAVVGCLGQGALKPPLPVQALLLRWLVLVYHVLSAPALAVLARSYAVLFNLLDTAGIRPPLCHVLVLVTRRKHVRPFRIQAL